MVNGRSPSPCVGKQHKQRDSARTTERPEEGVRRTTEDKRTREAKQDEPTKRTKEGQAVFGQSHLDHRAT